MTKDREKALLISLSQVSREIRSWIQELPSGSGSGSGDEGEELQHGDGCLNRHKTDDHQCLSRILVDLIVLLNAASQFVRHLAGSTLVVVFEFFAGCPSDWDRFIYLLCFCFVLALSNILSYPSVPAMGNEEFSCDVLTVNVLKSGLKDADWNTGSAILEVLRGVLKFLKDEDDEQLVEAFTNSLSLCIFNVHWELLDTIHAHGHYRDNLDSSNGSFLINEVEMEARILFLGNLVQLFSSLVDPTFFVEDPAESEYKLLIVHKILNLLPKALFWCLDEDWSCKSPCILPYFQHKTLMLMIRLYSQTQFDRKTLSLWLGLLHKYFRDLLVEPIYRLDTSDDDSLEGSPFLSSLYGQVKQYPLSRHLRGQAVFLFLRCCLSLIGLREASNFDGSCTRETSCLASNINAAECCCAPRRGLLELFAWLQGQVSFNMVVDCKIHVENCVTFASYFIQLYMHQDDLLFEVLLLLFSIPSCSEKWFAKAIQGSEEPMDVALFHVSNLFHPTLLFYVFLAKLHYDHQMLLDYLISKDTGTRCAEYLLRCLRAVCDSWEFFLELSFDQEAFSQPCKRKKVYFKHMNSYEEPSSISRKGVLALPIEQDKNDHYHVVYGPRIRSLLFARAKSCLLSLKDALEKLHRRNLFPYNPQVLLKRLTKFEELCNEHANFLAHKISLAQ
ncbi:hypothetical protein Dimus_017094 [Dionaea muscipula]